eukprot:scaffold534154_cov47-Prasinocladus_malaysianus.AAC.1
MIACVTCIYVQACDILCGGTSCQGYSMANGKRGTRKQRPKAFDSRHDLVHVFLSIIASKRPKYVLWENVVGCTNPVPQPVGALDHFGFGEIMYGLA